jgi:hypothetical protein
LSGRKWQKDADSEVRYFLNAEATRFQVLGEKSPSDQASVNDQLSEAGQDDDDVPF